MSTSSKKRTLDEQVRRDYLASRSAQLSAALKALKPPLEAKEAEQPLDEPRSLVKPIVDGIVKDGQGNEDEDGLLHKDALKEDLVVKIPMWENLPTDPMPFFETVQLKYSLTGAPDSFKTIGTVRRLDLPIDPGIFPLEMALPKQALPRDAKLWVLYAHKPFNTSQPVDSLPIQLTCDAVAPWDEQEPRFEQAPSEPINEAYLGLHPAGIELTLADYPDRKPGDRCDLYYLTEWPRSADDLTIVASSTVLDDTLKVTVPIATVRNRDDGRFYITYLLYDKATNRSRMAFPVQVDVVLGPQPEDLLPPEVPLAADGVVGLQDALAGVTVRIPAYSNRKNKDVLLIKWGDGTLDEEPVGTRPFPVDVPVPNAILHTDYGAATGPKTTRVSYQVMRGEVAYGPASTAVDADFSVVGPERPDPDPTWPDPINTNLAPPKITSSTGLDNELAPADRGKDATLSFPLYANAADGHVMDFYWGGTLVTEARYVVRLADSPEVKRDIPWRYISEAGNHDQLPVHYTVRGDVDAINEQESPRQLVNVHAISMTPDPMEFLDLDGPWLNCSSLWFDPEDPKPVFRAKVPPLSRFNVSPGTRITLNWYVTKDMDGKQEIVEVKLVESPNLSADDIEKGFIWQIGPYDRHILPIYNHAPMYAFAHVFYAVIVPGNPLVSDATQSYVSIAVSDDNLTCHV